MLEVTVGEKGGNEKVKSDELKTVEGKKGYKEKGTTEEGALDDLGLEVIFKFEGGGESFVNYIKGIQALRSTQGLASMWHIARENRRPGGCFTYSDGVCIIQYMFYKEIGLLDRYGPIGFAWVLKRKVLGILKCCLQINLYGQGVDWRQKEQSFQIYEYAYLWVRILEKLCLGEMVDPDIIKAIKRPPDNLIDELCEKSIEEKISFLNKEMNIDRCKPVIYPLSQQMIEGLSPIIRIFLDSSEVEEHLEKLYTEVAKKVAEAKREDKIQDTATIAQIAAYLHNGIIAIHPYETGNGFLARSCVGYFLVAHGYIFCGERIKFSDESWYYSAVKSDFSGVGAAKGVDDICIRQLTTYFIEQDLVKVDVPRLGVLVV